MSVSATEGQGQAPADQGTGQGQAPAGEGTQGQDPTGTQGTTDQGTPPADFDPSTVTDPALKAYLDKLAANVTRANQEAAQHRVRATELQRQNETDAERVTREAQEAQAARDAEAARVRELEAEVQGLRVGTAVEAAVRDARAINPTLVATMLRSSITVGDDGQPSNLAEALAALRTSDPYLFRRTSNDAGDGQGSGSSPAGGMNDTIRAALAARRGR